MKTVIFSLSLVVSIFSLNAFATPGQNDEGHKVCICHNIKVEGKKPQCVDVASVSGMGHLLHTSAPVEDVITDVVCQNTNDCGANVCGAPEVQCTTGTHLLNGVCVPDTCSCTTNTNCDCSAHIEDHADFQFNIEAGGIDSSLYVCEVGFFAHSCPSAGTCGGDYIQVGDKKATFSTPLTLSKVDKLKSGVASVYLNSLNAGSKFYVRYCLDVERKVVGTPTDGAFHGLLTGTLKLTAGNDSNYFNTVGLEAEAFHACSSLPLTAASLLSLGHFEVSNDLNEEIPTSDCLNFPTTSASTKKYCSWMVVYSETNKCLRKLYKAQEGDEGVTRSGMVRSSLDFGLDFTCGNCNL
jgi:hypothetical protein